MDLSVLSQKFNKGTGRSFAAIRLPGEQSVYFFYADQTPRLQVLNNLNEKPVFVCSPYAAGNRAYVLDPDLVYRDDDLIYQKHGSELLQKTEKLLSKTTEENKYSSADTFSVYVKKAVGQMRQGKFVKVVAARAEFIPQPQQYDYAAFFYRLMQQYTDACVYYFSIPGIGTWAGASPEKLLAVEPNHMETVALAGTIHASESRAWSDKEIREQSVTADFIRKCLVNAKLKFSESKVHEIVTGDLRHLCSEFHIEQFSDTQQKTWERLLSKLNPTPAVCGETRSSAMSFISENENLERRFYSGFIGMMKGGGEGDLFVNIRCLQWINGGAILYAGAGLTPDSDAHSEWMETERKMQAIKKLL